MRDGDRLRSVDNNSWEGCGMKIPEQAVLEMMNASAKPGIRFVKWDANQYRHQNPFDSTTPSLNFISQDRSHAVIPAYHTGGIICPLTVASP